MGVAKPPALHEAPALPEADPHPPEEPLVEWIRACDVCLLTRRDPSPKPTVYLAPGRAWICEECWGWWSLNPEALQQLWGMWTALGVGLFQGGLVPPVVVGEAPSPAAPQGLEKAAALIAEAEAAGILDEDEPQVTEEEEDDEPMVWSQPEPQEMSIEAAQMQRLAAGQGTSPVLQGLGGATVVSAPRTRGAFKPTRRSGVLVPRE